MSREVTVPEKIGIKFRGKIGQLLEGQARIVSRSLRRCATMKALNAKQREPIDQCATYLANHAPYLDYPRFLAK